MMQHEKLDVNDSYGIEPRMQNYRGGYAVEKTTEKKISHHNYGFNELVVNRTVLDIINKHMNDLKKKFNLSQEDIDSLDLGTYNDYKGVLDAVANDWMVVKKAQFTGNLMHLRQVEKQFGPNTLRVLAMLEADKSDKNDKILRYFQTASPAEREKLAGEIIKSSIF